MKPATWLLGKDADCARGRSQAALLALTGSPCGQTWNCTPDSHQALCAVRPLLILVPVLGVGSECQRVLVTRPWLEQRPREVDHLPKVTQHSCSSAEAWSCEFPSTPLHMLHNPRGHCCPDWTSLVIWGAQSKMKIWACLFKNS